MTNWIHIDDIIENIVFISIEVDKEDGIKNNDVDSCIKVVLEDALDIANVHLSNVSILDEIILDKALHDEIVLVNGINTIRIAVGISFQDVRNIYEIWL